ncbi:MAG TPA: GTP 3',8-cyclase MoaA [Gemmatimonadales bacterium]|nr:GTP 3',8-cyclase MoaA [Gemmatimonadales bacterium]
MTTTDQFGRPLGALRISVTDRCNLRCRYCMPAASYRWLPGESLLSFNEIERVARAFAELGVRKFRLTGGEPLLRPELASLIARLAAIEGITDLALTTNGTRLAPLAGELKRAGLHRLTVSLDTLEPDAMRALTRHGRPADVFAGLDAAAAAGFTGTKLNTVVMRGVNDRLLVDIMRVASDRHIEPRFIEYMDVGGATDWRADLVVSSREIVGILAAAFGGARPVTAGCDPHAPATRWRLGNGMRFGIVASTTTPFCRDCDRARLTADGTWFTCLYAPAGVDLRQVLRSDADHAELVRRIRTGWQQRRDRGAEDRLTAPGRGALVTLGRLREDPHLEMHVRGG